MAGYIHALVAEHSRSRMLDRYLRCAGAEDDLVYDALVHRAVAVIPAEQTRNAQEHLVAI